MGTIASREVNAFARVTGRSGYTVVGINSALIDLVYQAAKSVVAAAHPVRSKDGKSDVRANISEEALGAELGRNPEPVERLYRTLEAYYFQGYPRAFADEPVREENHPALSVLISMSERFVVAHEYGHKYTVDLDWEIAASGNPDWVREFLADQLATAATVLSGQTLDHFDPAVSLSGGVFSLACLEILAQGLSIVRTGEIVANQATDTHPSPRTRAQRVVDGFFQAFHAQVREDGRGCEVTLIVDPRRPTPTDPRVRKQISEGAFCYANALFTVWKRVRQRLLQDYDNKRPLHSMWSLPAD